MGLLTMLPTAATPADRILARFNRDQLAGFIEVAISLLDAAEGDPDTEDNGDREGAGRFAYNAPRASSQLLEDCDPPIVTGTEDDEDDDPAEEDGDEQDTGGAEDEELSGVARQRARQWAGYLPGCPISDACGGQGEDVSFGCPTYGIDQRRMVSESEAFEDLNGISPIRVAQPENDQ